MMKAVVYRGPRDVSVENVPDPKIERPTDAIVQIRSTNICGSDLHMFEGRTDFEKGRVSDTRTSARSRKWGRPLSALKSATGCACLSISAVAIAGIAKRD
jgi:hypothetical protein